MKNSFLAISISLVFMLLIGVACKKKDSPPVVQNGTQHYQYGGNGYPSGSYVAYMVASAAINPPYLYKTGAAFFSQSPFTLLGPPPTLSLIPVASVYMGGTRFSYMGMYKEYVDSTMALSFPNANWVVNGADAIPSFSFANTDPVPAYNGTLTLPGVVTRSLDLVIPLASTTGADQVVLGIQDTANTYKTFAYAAGVTSITVPKDTLLKFKACTTGWIQFQLLKYNPRNISGINVLFVTSADYSSNLQLK